MEVPSIATVPEFGCVTESIVGEKLGKSSLANASMVVAVFLGV